MSRKTRTIAVVTSALGCHSRAFCEGAAEYVRRNCGWMVRLVLCEELRSAEMLRSCDGIIARELGVREYDILEKCGRPVVEASVRESRSHRFPSVDCDERVIGRLAAEHFLKRGFTSFAFCGFPSRVDFSDAREQYFCETLKERGLTVRRYPTGTPCFLGGPYSPDLVVPGPDDELAEWAQGLPKGTGVFCANDVMARQLLCTCIERRISVSGYLAILGVDNDLLFCNLNAPGLSSVDPNARGIGAAGAELLLRILSGREAAVKGAHLDAQPGGVVVRASTEVYRMGPPWLSDALVEIDRNAATLTASDVYRLVRKSHTAVDGAFSEFLGTTVQKRILAVRMEEAKTLLEGAKTPVADIAKSLGFPSAQYFSSTFKLHFNATPAAYRRARARG